MSNLACVQAPGGASAEQTFGAKRRAIPIARRFAPNVCSVLAPPGACSQARDNKARCFNLKRNGKA